MKIFKLGDRVRVNQIDSVFHGQPGIVVNTNRSADTSFGHITNGIEVQLDTSKGSNPIFDPRGLRFESTHEPAPQDFRVGDVISHNMFPGKQFVVSEVCADNMLRFHDRAGSRFVPSFCTLIYRPSDV